MSRHATLRRTLTQPDRRAQGNTGGVRANARLAPGQPEPAWARPNRPARRLPARLIREGVSSAVGIATSDRLY